MDIGWPEILIIAVVILVLFGSRKMPDAARALGRSLRILKTEVKGLHDDDDAPAQPAPPAELPAGSSAIPAPSQQAPSQQAQSPSTTGAGERTDLH
jgi:sec-independent protein translocase protein TatA